MSRTIHWLRLCALPVLLMAVTCVTASAQDAPAPPPPAAPATQLPAPPTTMDALPSSGTTSGSMDLSSMDMNGADYRLLSNPNYDYVDLTRASRLGYSDREIATISKIARLSGWPFSFILNRVHVGRTFALLASDYNLRLGDVLDATDEQARIARYLSLYESLDELGTVHTAYLSTAQTISGPTLTELEARFNQLNAAFPALPPTNIETSQIGTETETVAPVAVAQAPPPPPPAPEAAPAPEAPPPAVVETAPVVTHVHHARRHRHHAVRRHHHHRVRHVTRMGS